MTQPRNVDAGACTVCQQVSGLAFLLPFPDYRAKPWAVHPAKRDAKK
ncbi:hypothetical protein [Rufibacter tibetensis]|nr:hypothetical protein [Rufibacter tibetensis]